MTVVEEPLDRLLDDRPVRIPFPAAVLGELPENPCLSVVAKPAGAAGRDQRVYQLAQRQRAHDRAPCTA